MQSLYTTYTKSVYISKVYTRRIQILYMFILKKTRKCITYTNFIHIYIYKVCIRTEYIVCIRVKKIHHVYKVYTHI